MKEYMRLKFMDFFYYAMIMNENMPDGSIEQCMATCGGAVANQ